VQWASKVIPSRRLILGRNPLVWSVYGGFHVLRARLERFIFSPGCPAWVRDGAWAEKDSAVVASGQERVVQLLIVGGNCSSLDRVISPFFHSPERDRGRCVGPATHAKDLRGRYFFSPAYGRSK
jgi:hypothetical protein